MHICEAFEKVLQSKCRPELIEFDKVKSKELFKFAKRAKNKCLVVIHAKI
jgi:hypothetical protein